MVGGICPGLKVFLLVYCGGLRPVPPIRGAVDDDDDDDCLDDGHDGHERMLGGSPPGPPGG